MLQLAALAAAVGDIVAVAGHFRVDRFHQPAAFVGAIAGVDVDMFAPKAIRAMVGVAVAFDFLPAFFAGEILDYSLEFGGHCFLMTIGE